MPKATAQMLDAIAKLAGIEGGIPPTITRHEPLGGPRGSKVIVCAREPMKQVGAIWIPTNSQARETDGWIIAASTDVGGVNGSINALSPYVYCFSSDGEPLDDDVDQVLGLHVAWGKFVGTDLRSVSIGPDPLEGRFLMMVEQDLLSVIGKVEVTHG